VPHRGDREPLGGEAEARPGALLVGLELRARDRREVDESLNELALLAATAGYGEAGRNVSRRERPHPATFVGKGKAREIAAEAAAASAAAVIFDDELTPTQVNNLSEFTRARIIDRTELILDIFAARARTSEARLQIELARLTYLLPRLAGAWSHLNRQRGGTGGTRDAGEKQVELDRRRARDRIHRLRKQLIEVGKTRAVQRGRRARREVPTAAMIGYTNAGKSTLFNALTAASVPTADRLFSTLDPTTRAAELPSGRRVLFSDTVGFIRKLPHHLVDSFRATLEEVLEADVLLEVLDASHSLIRERKAAVEEVLKELGADDKPRIVVLNKTDLVRDPFLVNELKLTFGSGIAVSAREKTGLDALLAEIERVLGEDRRFCRLVVPQGRADVISLLYREGEVKKTDYNPGGVYVEAILPLRRLESVREFMLPPPPRS